MLTVTPLKTAGGAERYYTKIAHYYAKEYEQEHLDAIAWYGKGCQLLGLLEQFDKNIFNDLLQGKLPDGTQLGVYRQGELKHRPGLDMTFSAPKTVSILALVGGDRRLLEAHSKSVEVALDYAEKLAAQTRVRQKGEIQFEKTGNWVVALFREMMSRAGDPQIHTHCVIPNVTQRMDGKWVSLASDRTHRQGTIETLRNYCQTVGQVYRSQLAYYSTQMGYNIVEKDKGLWEIEGVPDHVIRAFSQRSEQIQAFVDEKGWVGEKAEQAATLLTRPQKVPENFKEAVANWHQREEALGFCAKDCVTTGKNQSKPTWTQTLQRWGKQFLEQNFNKSAWMSEQKLAVEAVRFAGQVLSEREAAFDNEDLVKLSMQSVLSEKPIDTRTILNAIDQLKSEGDFVAVNVGGCEKLTTPWAVKIEDQLIRQVIRQKNTVSPLVGKETILASWEQQAKFNEFALTKMQRVASAAILRTTDRIIGIQGDAGSGKTTMLRFVNALARQNGFTLRGLAPTGNAAQQLQEASGISSQTVQGGVGMLQRQQQQQNSKDLSQTIFVCDEASMLDTDTCLALVKAVVASNSRLILVGDRKQIPSPTAGKPFELLQDNDMTTFVMSDNVRSRDPFVKEAVALAKQGRMTASLNKLDQSDLLKMEHKQLKFNYKSSDRANITRSPKQMKLSYYDLNALQQQLTHRAEEIAKSVVQDREFNAARSSQHTLVWGKKHGSLRVHIAGERAGQWYDFETGSGGHLLQLIQTQQGMNFKEALTWAANQVNMLPNIKEQVVPRILRAQVTAPKEWVFTPQQCRKIAIARQLIQQSQPIAGTLAERYLREHRGITGSIPDTYRFHPNLRVAGKMYPALLIVAHNQRGDPQAIQRIFLDRTTANKTTELMTPKLSLGVQKNSLVLVQQGDPTHATLLAEGSETALSVANAMPNHRVYACLGSLSNAVGAIDPKQHQRIVLCADNDVQNLQTARSLKKTAQHFLRANCWVSVAKPEQSGKDFNDVLKESDIEAVVQCIKQAKAYANSTRVLVDDDKDKRLAELADRQLAAEKQQSSHITLIPTNEDRLNVNEKIREGLQQVDRLVGDKHNRTILVRESITKTELKRVASYCEGWVIRFNVNDKRLGIRSGDYRIINDLDRKRNILILKDTEGQLTRWQVDKKIATRKDADRVIEVYRQEKRELQVGERIRWRRNFSEQGVVNAQTATVIRIEDDQITCQLQDGAVVTLPSDHPVMQHWDYAYTATNFSAQGSTSRQGVALAESFHKHLTNQKNYYVQITRTRDGITLITDDKTALVKKLETDTGDKTSALETVREQYSSEQIHNIIQRAQENCLKETGNKFNFQEMVKQMVSRFCSRPQSISKTQSNYKYKQPIMNVNKER